MKIVCVPDSFKGSMSAAAAAAALAAGARQSLPGAEVLALPFADGGEGTLDALLAAWGVEERVAEVVDALGRRRWARWALGPDGATALIEGAEGNGLPAVADVSPQPLRADSFGVGLLVRAALNAGATRILLTLGGSASTDGGSGILRALGARLLDSGGNPVPPGGEGLAAVARVDLSGLDPRARAAHWELAVDVDNPLTGPRGAAAVFGPQKGAGPEDVARLDAGLARFAQVLGESAAGTVNADAVDPGARGMGAAGGIPLALAAVFGAQLRPGAQLVAEAVGLDAALTDVNLVLTGEGRLDTQSLAGKVVAEIRRRTPQRVPVVVIAGAVQLPAAACRDAGLVAFSLAPGPADLGQLRDKAPQLLEDAAAQACTLAAWGNISRYS